MTVFGSAKTGVPGNSIDPRVFQNPSNRAEKQPWIQGITFFLRFREFPSFVSHRRAISDPDVTIFREKP
jgi:hypothetical protein